MKTLKTTISKSKYFLLALLVAFSFACNPEDGADGAAGANGADGAVGADGADGNANVQTFIYDTSAMSGAQISLDIPEITQDVMDNDAIMCYIFNGLNYYQVPGGGPSAAYLTRLWFRVGSFDIPFHNWDGTSYSISAGDIDHVKVILIESTSTTVGKTANKRQQIYNELNQAGVNINDYYAVCDYYGIDY